MRLDLFFRLLFILYCIEAGVILVLAPWSPMWERSLAFLPTAQLRWLLLHPLMRGGVSGFGVIHLVWSAHDLDLLLTRRKRAES